MLPLAETLGCADPRPGCTAAKLPGAIVEIGVNRGPRYRIVAIDDGEAWLKPVGCGSTGVARVEMLRVVG